METQMLKVSWTGLYAVVAVLLATARVSDAQVTVAVSYDPPSPVPIGETVSFKCDFTLPSGQTLVQFYWELQNGDRIFEYFPGSAPQIPPDYTDKLGNYSTDDGTFLYMDFIFGACDVGQYQCYVLASNNDDNDDQQLITVQDNEIAPILKLDGREITAGETIELGTDPVTVSCELQNAGPPEPTLLELVTEYTNDILEDSSTRDDDSCTWGFNNPPSLTVFPNTTETYSFQCVVTYDGGTQQSSDVNLEPNCLLLDTDASDESGTYNVTIGDSLTLVCESNLATSISWFDQMGELVSNGSTLELNQTELADAGSYYCQLEASECIQQVHYNVTVDPYVFVVVFGENETANDTLQFDEGGTLELNLVLNTGDINNTMNQQNTQPIPKLLWRIGTVELESSDTGSVSYTKTGLTEEDEGLYVGEAIYLDSRQTLRTVQVVIGEGPGGGGGGGDGGLSDGELAAIIVVSVVVGIAIVGALVYLLVIKKERQK